MLMLLLSIGRGVIFGRGDSIARGAPRGSSGIVSDCALYLLL